MDLTENSSAFAYPDWLGIAPIHDVDREQLSHHSRSKVVALKEKPPAFANSTGPRKTPCDL